MSRTELLPLLPILLVASCLLTEVSPANILLMMPLATKSETHLLNPIAKVMLDRGHKVTFVTCASSSIKHSNFTEIIPTTPLDLSDFDPMHHESVLDMRRAKDDISTLLFVDMSYIYDKCHETYQHKDFAQVLEAESYDLVLTSVFFSECFMGLFHKLKAPFIQISSMPMTKEALDPTGLRTPLSFVPTPFIEFTDSMTLSERLINTLSQWSFTLLNRYHYYKIGENVYRQYLGADLPGVDELRKNVSMIFSNTHFSLNFPRPMMPDVVEIGGVHTQEAKPLPKDLEEFCSGGKHGFIFFSLGTVFREETLPESVKKIFINVFSRLKTRVLWKWKSELKGLPENVKVSKWLPQQDVLGHPNIKFFISHGGLLSTQEATYHGVPVIGIPLFVDQDVNIKQTEALGYGLKLELLDITEEYLENAIHRMLNDTSFTVAAKRASEIFRDQPQNPLDRAIYYMEYVMKYNGAKHLQSAARNLSYFEYYLYDVQLILLAVIGTVILLAWKIIAYCIACFGSGTRGKNRDRDSGRKSSKKYQ